MYKFVAALCLIAVAAGQLSNEYLPPIQEHHVSYQPAPAPVVHYEQPAPVVQHYEQPAVSYDTVDVEPAHTFSQDDGYRYKTAKRRVFRNRRVYRNRRRY